jgi:dCMP deaminase
MNTPSTAWARKFFDLAQHISGWSKDRSTKVGAVIFNPDTHAILSVGYNGFPRGVRDDASDVTPILVQPSMDTWKGIFTDQVAIDSEIARIGSRHERPLKYKWTVHAEENAILNCARHGIRTEGMAIALQWYPCMHPCACAIVQSGIETVICTRPDFNHPRFGEEFKLTHELFSEVKLNVVYLET